MTPVVGSWSGAESPRTSVTVVAPTIASANPNARPQGFTGNITITGTNFAVGATTTFSGTGITVNSTTVNSSTQLTVNITIATGATTGARNITVTNSDSGTGSCSNCFTVAPAPTVTSAASNFGFVNTTQSVSITGANFVSGATVVFSGAGITATSTTFNSSTQITVNITIATGAATGARNVTVTNPDTGTGSCSNCFTVAPAPTVTSAASNFGFVNTTQSVSITGANFVSGATVAFSGAGITVTSTTFNSSTQITVNITIATGAATGARNVTVTNPDTGTGSCSSCFTVASAPTVTSANPNSSGQGATSQNIAITGNFFVSGATVAFSGAGITVNSTTFNSSTQITVNITVTTGAATGARNATVTDPGGQSGSCTGCFTVTTRPGAATLNPNSRGQGATNQTITITGSNFGNGATVTFSGTGITVNSTTFNSATQLTVNITIAASAATGAHDVTITNPDGGTRTNTGVFTVAAAPIPTSSNPASRGAGTTGNVVITGTGFVNGATVVFSGTGITVNSTTFNSATQLTVSITIAAGTPTGSRDVTVTNPNSGTGTCTNCFTVT